MKYFLPLIWILLLQEILSLPPNSQLYFFRNNLDRLDDKQLLNDDYYTLDKNEVTNGLILENNLSDNKKRNAERNIEDMFNGDNAELNGVVLYPVVAPTKCPTQGAAFAPIYGEVQCQQAPGKLICNMGKYTFVINNGDHELQRDALERFVSMVYTRYEEGDDTFDVAVDEKETTACACYTTSVTRCANGEINKEESPVIVECSLISNEKLKMCNPNYDSREKLYECKVRTVGLRRKKRSIFIAVDKNGLVSHAERPTSSDIKARKKRELWPDSDETMEIKHDMLRPRSGAIHDLPNKEDSTEGNDLSNLYYHTRVPYVRNYTDRCTLQYEFYPWCPTYLTESPCQITVARSFNVTKRPCRRGVTRSADTSAGDTTDETTTCTIEVTTDDAFLKQTKKTDFRRKRRRRFWRRRRRLLKAFNSTDNSFGVEHDMNAYSNLNDFKNDRQFYADTNVNLTPQNSTDTSCLPCSGQETSTIKQTLSSSSQWCTITVPCNDTSSTFTSACTATSELTTSQQMVVTGNQQLKRFFGNFSNREDSFQDIQNQESGNGLYSVTASLPQKREFPPSNNVQMPILERPLLQSSFNKYDDSQRPVSQNQIRNNLRYDYENYDRKNQEISDNSFTRDMYHRYRPRVRRKRRLMCKKIPGLRKRHIRSWFKKRDHYSDVRGIAR